MFQLTPPAWRGRLDESGPLVELRELALDGQDPVQVMLQGGSVYGITFGATSGYGRITNRGTGVPVGASGRAPAGPEDRDGIAPPSGPAATQAAPGR